MPSSAHCLGSFPGGCSGTRRLLCSRSLYRHSHCFSRSPSRCLTCRRRQHSSSLFRQPLHLPSISAANPCSSSSCLCPKSQARVGSQVSSRAMGFSSSCLFRQRHSPSSNSSGMRQTYSCLCRRMPLLSRRLSARALPSLSAYLLLATSTHSIHVASKQRLAHPPGSLIRHSSASRL